MNDREMLELAAKAAGYEVLANKQAQRDEIGAGGVGLWIKGISTCWNPRDNSAQAFELGVRLSFCQTQWFNHEPKENKALRIAPCFYSDFGATYRDRTGDTWNHNL